MKKMEKERESEREIIELNTVISNELSEHLRSLILRLSLCPT